MGRVLSYIDNVTISVHTKNFNENRIGLPAASSGCRPPSPPASVAVAAA